MERQTILFLLPNWNNNGSIILADIQSIIKRYANIQSFEPRIWYASNKWDNPALKELFQYTVGSTDKADLAEATATHGLTPSNTIICSYGSWQSTTKIGFGLRKMGFTWIHNPTGLNNCFANEAFRSYWTLLEKPMIETANFIRSIDLKEYEHLKSLMGNSKKIVFVPNAISVISLDLTCKIRKPTYILCQMDPSTAFNNHELLIKAWNRVIQNWNAEFELILASRNKQQLSTFENILKEEKTIGVASVWMENLTNEISCWKNQVF